MTTIRLDPIASRRLAELRRALRVEGYSADNGEIVSGLIFGATAWQAEGPIRAYIKQRARERDARERLR